MRLITLPSAYPAGSPDLPARANVEVKLSTTPDQAMKYLASCELVLCRSVIQSKGPSKTLKFLLFSRSFRMDGISLGSSGRCDAHWCCHCTVSLLKFRSHGLRNSLRDTVARAGTFCRSDGLGSRIFVLVGDRWWWEGEILLARLTVWRATARAAKSSEHPRSTTWRLCIPPRRSHRLHQDWRVRRGRGGLLDV